ncbi:TetR/AcrR family transcriptional regulator [Gordonia sp. (in: high G+C Gram-positive bacteria)]|uniref:TetR/AcrR family transcriptional regulator n=1 Tax=Gordonia sp. (in: high G+C Gram-positive bacteria) TaxID=84139 RepID=UPI003C78B27A
MDTPPVRERLLNSATILLRSKGADGFGITELMAHSGVARRSMYLHFPDGKAQLLAEATVAAGQFASGRLAAALATQPAVDGFCEVINQWKRVLTRTNYEFGCPLVSASIASAEYPDAAAHAAAAFTAMADQLATALERGGMPADTAQRTGNVLVSSMEGAIITARATRSLEPLDALAEHTRQMWG